jgi:hypothetical protein
MKNKNSLFESSTKYSRMKNKILVMLIGLVLISGLFFTGCPVDSTDGTSEEESKTTKFEGTWKYDDLPTEVKNSNEFSYVFSEHTFRTVFKGPVFEDQSAQSGIFTFTDTEITFIYTSTTPGGTLTQPYTLEGKVLTLEQNAEKKQGDSGRFIKQ